ncbi:P-loop containing nucleoside triphosphate hydrolase protein [Tirmania nivea]|nr:P-loop containing nucleoside triphosphate hydrolase protein [Tirmania nivea]
MSKPILVASVPRACSTAFERVFMTRTDILNCHHEPFGEPFYYGPERLGSRFDGETLEAKALRNSTGFSHLTYKDIVDQLLSKSPQERRLFIKDISTHFVPPPGKPGIAPSLSTFATRECCNGVTKTNSTLANGHASNGQLKKNPKDADSSNPTLLPISILSQFQITFLIRHPSSAIPSYYRCTVPPLSDITGFHYFDPEEAGFREARILLQYLIESGLLAKKDIVLIDADDLLDNPHAVVEEYCRRVGIEFREEMLSWEEKECKEFEKWKGFHEDAMKSGGLKARTTKKPQKSDEENFKEWKEKYGEEGAKLIQTTVRENILDYEWMRQFRIVV